MIRKTFSFVTASAVALGLAAGCGSTVTAHSPPGTALAILRADGFTPDSLHGTLLAGTVSRSIFPAALNKDITSWAIGDRGSESEIVVILTLAAAAQAGVTKGINGQPATTGPVVMTDAYGVTISRNGTVLKITGTRAQLNADPLNS